ncbi:serpin family protein, partial [Streptomyces parvus]
MTDGSTTSAISTTRAIQHLAQRWIQDGMAAGAAGAAGTAGRGRGWGWRRARTVPAAGFVCSPAGLWLALAAVAAGARGGTAAELRVLLGTADREAAPAGTEVAREL